jgi:hypothetical protein
MARHFRALTRGAAWLMRQPDGTGQRARYLSSIVLLYLAGSCTTLRPIPGAGLGRAEGEWLGHARVVLRDGTQMDLEEATIRRDSIAGLGGLTATRFVVARSDVARVETLRTSNPKTFLLGLLAPVAVAWLWAGVMQAADD